MSKKKALGRGLSALLSDTPDEERLEVDVTNPVGSHATTPYENLNEIPLDEIETNPFQPRQHFDQEALKELAESIKVHGIIQPITVRKLARNQYQLISGERRFQASRMAGLKSVPAYIRTADDQQMLEMALIENIQRENLNPIEISLSYQRLISECNLKQEELGDRVGKNRSTVTNYLRLLKLPPDIQIAVRTNVFPWAMPAPSLMLIILIHSFTSLKKYWQKIYPLEKWRNLLASSWPNTKISLQKQIQLLHPIRRKSLTYSQTSLHTLARKLV
jgi:ParB family chromosome partitioning protein